MRGGKGQVAILSDEIYQSRFNRDAYILGSTFIADGKPFVVVGVLPPAAASFAIWGGMEQKKPKLWTPLDVHPEKKDDEAFSLFVFGRLKEEVSLTAARRVACD
jgi:hypothetical protein